MSTATELTRIQNAKAAIRTSIENKGVTVPSSDLIDAYSQYIDAISASTPTQTKSVTIASNTTTTVTPDSGYALSEVSITTAVPGGASDIQAIGQAYLDVAAQNTGTVDMSSQDWTQSGAVNNNYYGLSGCTELILPTGVEGLCTGSLVFESNMINGCDLVIPATVRNIYSGAIGCPEIMQSTIPSWHMLNITFEQRSSTDTLTIYNQAFSNAHINSLVIPANTTFKFDIGTNNTNYIFYKSQIRSLDLSACTSLTSLDLYFLASSSYLTTVVLPQTVTSIGNNAFISCGLLTSVNLPSGLTSIGDSAFANCSNLTPLTVPAGVTNLPASCFRLDNPNCEIHFLATTPPTKVATTFGSTSSSSKQRWPKVYVPYSSDHSVLAAYQSAWSDVDALGKLFEEAAPTP